MRGRRHVDIGNRRIGPGYPTYVVAEMSPDGPIVESWFSADGRGRLMRQRSNGITIEHCTRNALEKNWSKQLREIRLTAQEKD